MQGKISRRQFLKGAAAMAGLAAAGSLNPMLKMQASAEEKQTEPEKGYYEVYHTDLLIIGGGNAGLDAAREAVREGRQVMIVDKAPFRHNGVSGMSWDVLLLWGTPLDWLLDPQINPVIKKKAYEFMGAESFNSCVDLINAGQTIPHRGEDGDTYPYLVPGCANSVFYRREMDDIIHKGVSIMDQTMITDIFENNGRCLGAAGIYLPTGTYRVILADATIMAANAGMLFRGHHNIGYYGISSEDCTGDVDMALFRHGMTIGSAEYAQYDINAIEPADFAHTMGAAIMADGAELHAIYDKDHNQIFPNGVEEGDGNLGMIKTIAKAVNEEGRGTEHGGILIHFGDHPTRYNCTRNAALAAEYGLDPYNDYVEAMPEMFEHGGSPVIDENMMTEWEGLFDTRGADTYGAFGGARTTTNKLFSAYTMKCAIDYLKQGKTFDEEKIDWTPVEKEFARLDEIRTRKVEGGKRPHVIREMIQDAGARGFDVYRPTAWMEEAVAELERIRKEEMPLQVCADDTVNFNTEWKAAIENINLLDCAEVSIRASLLREESRGSYYRPEFPGVDNENWNCMLTARMVDGEMVFAKREIPQV